MDLPHFTLVGATTRAGQLTAPLRDRFGMLFRLELYTPEELAQIVSRSAGILEVERERDGVLEIASRSRGTPRIANRHAQARAGLRPGAGRTGVITYEVAREALNMLDVDELGLDRMDRQHAAPP